MSQRLEQAMSDLRDAYAYQEKMSAELARLRAEVERLRKQTEDDAHRIAVNSSALMHAKNTNSRERCELVEARAALARAVEIVRAIDANKGGWAEPLRAFLAEHGGDR
jgi:F0F1-type ATP synthase membrane subunit b/b'